MTPTELAGFAHIPPRVAKRYAFDATTLDVLTKIATVRLAQCAEKYDPARGRFQNFARHELRKACARARKRLVSA